MNGINDLYQEVSSVGKENVLINFLIYVMDKELSMFLNCLYLIIKRILKKVGIRFNR